MKHAISLYCYDGYSVKIEKIPTHIVLPVAAVTCDDSSEEVPLAPQVTVKVDVD